MFKNKDILTAAVQVRPLTTLSVEEKIFEIANIGFQILLTKTFRVERKYRKNSFEISNTTNSSL